MRSVNSLTDLQTLFSLGQSTAERLVRERSKAVAANAVEAPLTLELPDANRDALYRATGRKPARRATAKPDQGAKSVSAFRPAMLRV